MNGVRSLVEERFDNRVAQNVLMAVAELFGQIGLAGLVEPSSRVEGAVYLMFGAFSMVRARRSSCVVVDGSGVMTRSMLRTPATRSPSCGGWRWRWVAPSVSTSAEADRAVDSLS